MFKMAMRHFGPHTKPPTASHTCWDIPPNLTYGHWYPKFITFWVKSTKFCISHYWGCVSPHRWWASWPLGPTLVVTLQSLIRTFGNRCLSAIGGGNRWSRLVGWVQLSAEATWPPRNTTSATLCAQATMRLFFGLQYDFLNHNDVMIIGTYFFLRKGTRKTTTDTKMG